MTRSASAQNLLTNAEFDSANGLSGWIWLPDATLTGPDDPGAIVCSGASDCGRMQYSADECCTIPNSGSAKTTSSFFYREGIMQCVIAIVPGSDYDFGAWMRITSTPGFQPGLPTAQVFWYPTADCTGSAISGNQDFALTTSSNWSRSGVSQVTAPMGTQSARFLLIAGPVGLNGSYVDMEFDSTYFGPSGSVPVKLQSFSIE
ncbi:MAG: hypothetical protein ABI866_02005 [Dokdonella sp.]